jgi:hypothetical protein
MKANEIPEKIYMTPSFGEPDNVLLASFSKSHLDFHRDIEYTRTDAFIKKACEWLENNLQGIVGGSIYIEDFRAYMKGE